MDTVQDRLKEVPLRTSAVVLFTVGVVVSAVSNPSSSIISIVVWTVSVPVLVSVLAYNSISRASLTSNILLATWGIISVVTSLLLGYGWQSANPELDQHTFLQIFHLNIQTTRLVNGGLDFIFTTAALTAHYAIVALLVERYDSKHIYALLLFAPLTVFLSTIVFIFVR
mgnify:FL=1